MPRKREHYAARARRIFLRGLPFKTVDAAIAAGARTNEEWCAILDGQQTLFYSQTGRKGRKRVRKRHPMRVHD